jgi:hypothetical protein
MSAPAEGTKQENADLCIITLRTRSRRQLPAQYLTNMRNGARARPITSSSLKHETLSGKRKSGEEHRRNSLLRHSLIASAFALATIRLRGSQATRHLRTSRAIRATARSCTTSTPTNQRRALLLGPVSWARLSSSVCFGGANYRSTWRRSVPRLLFDWRLLISHHHCAGHPVPCRVLLPAQLSRPRVSS